MLIARGTKADLDVVLGLIEEARRRLETKGTDQWQVPWPNREARDARVLAGLENGKTWIVWDRGVAAATVTTATRANTAVWKRPDCECDLSERAVYAHRLITARDYVGSGLGAELIDWTGLWGRRAYGAKWIRIDVWRSNYALHDYYLGKAFEACGYCTLPNYPSSALFQKPVSAIDRPSRPRFTEFPELVQPSADHELVGAGACSVT